MEIDAQVLCGKRAANIYQLFPCVLHCSIGCVRFGNPDLDFQNPDFGFPIEREIRKRISTMRYLFLDFHFYRSIGKSAKGFEKLFLRTAVLHAHV